METHHQPDDPHSSDTTRHQPQKWKDPTPYPSDCCLRLAASIVGAGDAADVVQIAALEHASKPDDGLRSPHAAFHWLVRNRAIDFLRNRDLHRIPELVDGDEARIKVSNRSESSPEKHEESVRLQVALAKLRPNEANAIRLFYFEGKSYEEIAKLLGLPLATVKSHLHRARRELRLLLGDRPPIV